MRVVPFAQRRCNTCDFSGSLGDLRVKVVRELLIELIMFDCQLAGPLDKG